VEVNARKTALGRNDALRLAHEVDEIYVARGKRVVHIDLRSEKPDDDTLAALLLNPAGNLRAPALKKGRILIVGFDEATYESLL
jgi:arsenate reductase-like glutaredoxin family protein